jgi:hypothetical protein
MIRLIWISVQSNDDRIDLYTDRDGNHLIVQKSNQLVYYLFTATGTQVRSSVRDNNVSEDPRLSKIAGYQGKIYIVYKEGGYIKTQYTTDAGANWSTDISEIELSNNTVNGLELSVNAEGFHLVNSEFDGENSVYETFYQMLPHGDNEWTDFKQVTDETDVTGGFPSVTTSPKHIHATFTSGNTTDPENNRGVSKTRDRDDGEWESSQEIYDDAARSMVAATSGKLHGFYYQYNQSGYMLWHKSRDLDGTTWSEAVNLHSYYSGFPGVAPVDIAVTNNDRMYVIFSLARYHVWISSGWQSWGHITPDAVEFISPAISANSNDIYIVWINAYQREGLTGLK